MVSFYEDYVVKMFSIEGKTVIVIDATSTLGGAIAATYATYGAEVVLTGRSKEKLEVLIGEMHDADGKVLPYTVDPSVEEQVKGLVVFAAKQYDGLDILAVSHGYNKPQNILDQSVEDWQYIVDAGLKSVYVIVKYAGEQIARRRRGDKMVATFSTRPKMGMAGYTGYCTSKGVRGLVIQSLACDPPVKYNININTINPTVFRSELTEWMSDAEPEVCKNFLKRFPIGWLGEPPDFVRMIVLLVAPASDFSTGENYDAAGSYWAR